MRTRTVFLVGALVAATGCQTYEPRPLDLERHVAAWSERTPASAEVAAFVRRLEETLDEDRPPFDLTDGLSRDESEIVAIVFNPDLRIARLRAGVASASAEHAGRWDDPQLELDVLRILSSVDDPWVTGVGLGFTLPTSGRLSVEKARADAALAAELDRVAESEWDIRRQVRDAWTGWSAARLRLEETEGLVAALESIVGSTTRLAEIGEMPRTEAALFAIEHTRQTNEVRRLRGVAASAAQDLRELLGLSPAAPLDLRPRLDPASPSSDFDTAASDLRRRSPTLARLRREYDVAEHALNREIRKQYPDITIGPRYEADEGQSRIGLGLGLPLPFFNANRAGIAEAIAQREVARAVYETTYEHRVGRLKSAFIELASARDQLTEVERDLVPLVDRQVADAGSLLSLGEGSGLVLLEGLTRAHDTKLRLIELRADAALAGSAIEHLIGPEIDPHHSMDHIDALPSRKTTP